MIEVQKDIPLSVEEEGISGLYLKQTPIKSSIYYHRHTKVTYLVAKERDIPELFLKRISNT